MSSKNEPLVLVGFGKHDLKEVLSWFGTSKELEAYKAPTLWPPRWRPERLCTGEDINLFIQYVQKVKDVGYIDYINF